jgi:hypothetical protein
MENRETRRMYKYGKLKRLELWWQCRSRDFRFGTYKILWRLIFVEQRLPVLQRRSTRDGQNVEEILIFETDIMAKISTFSGVRGFITIFTTDSTSPRSVQSSVPLVVFYVNDSKPLADRQEKTEAGESVLHCQFCQPHILRNSSMHQLVLSGESPAQAARSALDYVAEGYADQTSSLSQLHRYVVGWPGLTAKGSFASPCAADPGNGWCAEVLCIAFFLL